MSTTMMWFLTSLTATFQANPNATVSLAPSVEHCRAFEQIAPSLSPRMKRAFEIRCPEMVAGFNATLALANKPGPSAAVE